MSKVGNHSRRLPHGGGSLGGAAPEVSVDTADQENQWRWKCHFDYKRRQIKESSERTKEHQRERVLLLPTGESSKNIDGSTNLRDRRTTPTEQGGPRSLTDDKVERRKTTGGTHQYGTDGETTPGRFTREYRSFRLRPFVNRPL